MRIKVLALDLERTLISDAFYAEPRPGLRAFLDFCHDRFYRVAMFTCVDESAVREIVTELVHQGCAPAALADRLEYVAWHGDHKDLRFVCDAAPVEVLFVDDDAGWIVPEQRNQWVEIAGWDGGPDAELDRVRDVLERRLTDQP